MTDIPTTITRVVIVERSGVQEYWADCWDIRIQDDGHTLKLFAKGYGRGQRACPESRGIWVTVHGEL